MLSYLIKNKIVIFFVGILLFAGCATVPSEEKQHGNYVWPPPPQTPKIKWLSQFSKQSDVEKRSGFFAIFSGEEEEARLSRPNGIVADSAGNIYVADSDLAVVFVFDSEKHELRLIGGGILASPVGVAIDNSSGILYVTDSKLDKVFGFQKKDGRPVFELGKTGEYRNPSGIVVDEVRDRLYVADTQNHVIRVFKRNGEPLFVMGERGSGDGKFNFPTFVALDKEGNIYVSDSFNFRVQVFSPAYQFLKKFGRLGDISGSFTRQKGIGVDSDGNIYVIDAAFNNFQIFDKEGRLLLWVGEGGNSPGQFYLPSGLYIDKEDKIYVADTFNRRVQVFQYLKDKK